MKHITIKNLTIRYDNLTVLEDFNANFGAGLHWIHGHNGCGKSSLLKSLCGVLRVGNKTVNILNFDINLKALKAKSQLCFVADKPEVYPFMTGIQFLQMVAKIKGVNLSKDLYQWLEDINLTQFQEVEFSHMSFGTRRKFTLSTCLIGEPSVVLLDEPFNGLDKQTCEHLKQWLLHAKKEKCILIASHDNRVLKHEYDSIVELS